MATEVILLDSDDEDISFETDGSSDPATASINILNSKPLDLNALGIVNTSVRPAQSSVRYMSVPQPPPPIRPIPSSVNAANRIKTKTAISYTKTVMPLSSPSTTETVRTPVSSYAQTNGHRQTCMTPVTRSETASSGISALSLMGSTRSVRSSTNGYHHRDSISPSTIDSRQGSPGIAPTEPRRIVPESRLSNYTFEATGEKMGESERQLYPNAKFRCQYSGCRRTIAGNASFVSHLWAHIVAWKETVDDTDSPGSGSKKTDVDQLSTCPQCLARFHTPYLMQVHYTRCHSRQPQAVNRTTCAICEKDVGLAPNALRAHLALHDPQDAPYHCKRCRYRCTVRLHLYDHFVREHANTSTLMCPFCTFTLVVPSYKRKRPIIRVSEFVSHVISHETDARVACDICAQSFTNSADKQKHRKEHCAINPKWTVTPRDPETRSRIRSRLVAVEEKTKPQCSDCAPAPGSGLQAKKCLSCATAAYSESVIGRRRKGTDMALRRGIDSLQSGYGKIRYRCKCGMSTRDGNRMAHHYFYCQQGVQIINTSEQTIEQTDEDIKEDECEAEIFAVFPKKASTEGTTENEKHDSRKRKINEPAFVMLRLKLDISKEEDMNSATLFLAKSRENNPLESLKKYRMLEDIKDEND